MKSMLTIGRSSSCDIIVPDENVSREHARISIVGGNYVYEDVSRNGSVIGGRIIRGERITISPGTEILIAGRIPLPWAQVYSMLPLQHSRPYDGGTQVRSSMPPSSAYQPMGDQSPIDITSGILAFLVPIAGWIMFFKWRKQYPKKAAQANLLAWMSVAINAVWSITVLIIILS